MKKIYSGETFSYNIKKFLTPETTYEEFLQYFETYLLNYDIPYVVLIDKLENTDFDILLKMFALYAKDFDYLEPIAHIIADSYLKNEKELEKEFRFIGSNKIFIITTQDKYKIELN